MILSKKELKFYIAADRIMASKSVNISVKERLKNIISPDYIIMYLRSLRYVAYFTNTNKKNNIKAIYHRKRYKNLGVKLGFSIGYNTFGYGLLIPHYGTIVINGSTKAGNFCVLHTSTCIGGNGKVIGDGLYLSSGSFIMGENLKLGDNISIAANSLVNKSVLKSNILLVGSPAKIKKTYLPWYETKQDKASYNPKILAIKKLKKEINI
jgi:serine O-acetyltransferase